MDDKKERISKVVHKQSCEKAVLERKMSIPFFLKPRDLRTPAEIASITKVLLRIPFLKNSFNDTGAFQEAMFECSKHLKFESFHAGDIVFNIQDQGDKFYLILEGDASVYIQKDGNDVANDFASIRNYINTECKINPEEIFQLKDKLDDLESEIFLLINNSEVYAKRVSVIYKHQNSNEIQKNLYSILREYFSEKEGEEIMDGFIDSEKFYLHIHNGYLRSKCVKKLQSGDYFGELALTFGTQRAATIISSSHLSLATLSKEDYARVFSKFNEKMASKIEFFQPFTGTSSREGNLKCTYEFKSIKVSHGNFIFREGTKATSYYILEKGEVRLSCYMAQLKKLKAAELLSDESKGQLINLTTLGKNEILGLEDMLAGRNYRYSALAIEETHAYIISDEAFSTVKKINSFFYNALVNRSAIREKRIKERIESQSKSDLVKSIQENIMKNSKEFSSFKGNLLKTLSKSKKSRIESLPSLENQTSKKMQVSMNILDFENTNSDSNNFNTMVSNIIQTKKKMCKKLNENTICSFAETKGRIFGKNSFLFKELQSQSPLKRNSITNRALSKKEIYSLENSNTRLKAINSKLFKSINSLQNEDYILNSNRTNSIEKFDSIEKESGSLSVRVISSTHNMFRMKPKTPYFSGNFYNIKYTE